MSAVGRWQSMRDTLFGDRRGWAVFLAAAVFLALSWRLGFFINDDVTIATTLVNAANGHLALSVFPYSPHTATPGMHRVGDALYGRNYGEVALALPTLGFLSLLAALASLRVALVACWCLGVLALSHEGGVLLDEPRAFDRLGAAAALVLFAANLPVATTLDAHWMATTALQLATVLEAAFAAAVLYRLLAAVENARVGVAGGLALVLATPVGFWGTIPKRHALVATGTLCGLYCLYRSRADETADQRLAFRVGAYAAGALLAWVHPFEALAYCLAVAAVDLPTRPPTDPRTLAALAGGFLLALLPFLATNALVSGNALTPPRLTPGFDGDPAAFVADRVADAANNTASAGNAAAGASGGGGSVGGGSVGGAGGGGSTASHVASAAANSSRTLYARVAFFFSFVRRGLHILLDPDRLYHTFVRSGWIRGVSSRDGNRAVSLSALESMPLAAALVALPLYANRRLPADWRDPSPARTVDAVAAIYLVVFTLAYLPRLPLHAMVDLRYLVPAFAVAAYAVARVPGVARALDRSRVLAWTYAATVLVGGQLLVLAELATGMWTAEAVQFHAVLALATGALVLAWLLLERASGPRPRLGAAVLAIAAGVTTLFTLLAAWIYLPHGGHYLLPAVRWLATHLAFQ